MKTALATPDRPDWFDSEPTTADLDAIEAEWPAIAADLARLERLFQFDALTAAADLDVTGVDFSLN
ncbi:DUF6284 family protein [Glycomyces sp. A-F 0318]|uniref:DUF6284 family protein n=1 Tax=Glycomyces amatae TaxID=2881355 RepID=UPI001E58C2D7|nr:DUF6284 family protein [Glycomyces amatae]MCD0442481.1 DUF6284 family protein [Glycomyces amatae]